MRDGQDRRQDRRKAGSSFGKWMSQWTTRNLCLPVCLPVLFAGVVRCIGGRDQEGNVERRPMNVSLFAACHNLHFLLFIDVLSSSCRLCPGCEEVLIVAA